MFKLFSNQKGVAQVIVLMVIVTVVGTLVFFLLSALVPFNDNNFSQLFPKNPSHAASGTDTSYNIGVLVLKYFPLATGGQNIDISVTGDIGDPYAATRQKTIDIDNNLLVFIPKATKYLGYQNPNAPASLNYNIVDTKEFNVAVPMAPRADSPRYPDYNGIMTANNICNYVDNQNAREVWLWAYQGPNKSDGQPYLGILESKMSGPFGDISNSARYNDMPVCQHTYRVYTFNYGRGTAEAIHSWGHQMESEIDAVNRTFFRGSWQGSDASLNYSYYPQTLGVNGRCGSVHNPPNARFEYDYANPTAQNSDCLNWNADSIGTLTQISCQNWGCQDISDSNNSQLNYIVWNWQNLPGRNNTKTFQGQPFRNWWDIHGDFDTVMTSSRSLFLSSPTPTPNVSPLLGDIDGDGQVTIFDYNILVGNFNRSGASVPGDLDGDGRVTIFDYNILVGNFGKRG